MFASAVSTDASSLGSDGPTRDSMVNVSPGVPAMAASDDASIAGATPGNL